MTDDFVNDAPETINRCLNCPVPAQRDCKGNLDCQKYRNYGNDKPYYPSSYSYETFEELASLPGTIKQKAFAFGISWQTYYNWQLRYKAEKAARQNTLARRWA